MHMARFGQRPFQIPHQILDWLMFVARDRAQGAPVVLMGLESNSMEQDGGGQVVRVRNKRHAHPGADRLILEAQAVGVLSGPESENKCPGNYHTKRHRENQ
jgi:hypothetical protein